MTPVTKIGRCDKTQTVPFPDVTYHCTRPANHDGHHMTHDPSGRVIAEWYTDDEGLLHIETLYFKGHGVK